MTVVLAGARSRAGREVVVPGWYVEGHLDHAYALTAYKAQGLTAGRAFSLGDDGLSAEMGYTTLSRGRAGNDLYWVVPDRLEDTPRDPLDSLRRALATSRAQQLATESLGSVRALAAGHSVADLRHQVLVLGMRLRHELPGDRTRLIAEARHWAEQAAVELDAATEWRQAADEHLAVVAATPLWRRPSRASAVAEQQAAVAAEDGWRHRLAERQAGVAELEAAQAHRQQWVAEHAADLQRYAELQEAVTRRSADLVRAAAVCPPGWLVDAIGPYPEDRPGRRVWRDAAREILIYRDRYHEQDPSRALGPEPEPADVDRRYERRRVARQIPHARRALGLEPDRALDLGLGLGLDLGPDL